MVKVEHVAIGAGALLLVGVGAYLVSVKAVSPPPMDNIDAEITDVVVLR